MRRVFASHVINQPFAGIGSEWSRGIDTVVYSLSVEAFMDGNGDGGDFVGLRRRLDYLQSLGVDALWLAPI